MPIHFFSEDIGFELKGKRELKTWIKTTASSENQSIDTINYIFCSDEYLLEINQNHLNHNTLTDIITFQYHEKPNPLLGDIFISIPRVKENAEKFHQSFDNELHRVLIHGALHLLGYKDKTANDKKLMTSKEDYYLSLRPTK